MTHAFRKMHGLGNDFVIFDQRDGADSLPQEQIVGLAHRRLGVGFDQIVFMKPARDPKADIYLDMYNADGSTLEACGNASRCVADLLMRENGGNECTIQTVAGFLHCRRVNDNMIEADMGVPSGIEKVEVNGADAVTVNMGNPHCVFFVGAVKDVDLEESGPDVEHHIMFPNRTNVEYVQILSSDRLRMRVWERGTGVTMACGSGACASAVAAATLGRGARKVEVVLDGGSLFIDWRESDDHVLMTGPVTEVFDGTLKAL